jgi:signal transduction histidine kinase
VGLRCLKDGLAGAARFVSKLSRIELLLERSHRRVVMDRIASPWVNLLMNNSLFRAWMLTGWIWAGVGVSLAEPVDPLSPAMLREQQVGESAPLKRWLPARLRQLEAERTHLLQEIALLPQHDPRILPDHQGYHSTFETPGPEDDSLESSIDVKLIWGPELAAIAFSPAFNPLDSEADAYAFPTRFKVEVLAPQLRSMGVESVGTTEYNPEEWAWVKIIDWIDADFPDPGAYPVFFGNIKRYVRQIRITIPRVAQQSEDAFFALGELYLFRTREGEPADNMARWGPESIEITISDSFEMPPLWGRRYLMDGVVGLGVPLSAARTSAEDLLVTFGDEVPSSDPVEVVLDLGEVQRIGRIDLWPAAAPYLLAVPSIGFPGKISIELSVDPDFESSSKINVQSIGRRLQREDRLVVFGRGYDARYVRITMSGLPEYKGMRILGLGEISVSEYGKVFSTGCKVSATGIPAEYQDQLPWLVDGNAQSRRILLEAEWIKGLAQRRPLDRRLAVVEAELARARASWQTLLVRAGVWTGSLLCAALLGAMWLQRWQRRRAMRHLKLRITRDLHDEVGSSLGSITLAAKRMEDGGATSEGLSELALTAREASASLRDVVWLTDQDLIRLPVLLQKLAERAERVLTGAAVSIERSPDCPDWVVPLTLKRHLVMYFKEAVHNCARHSQATQVWIAILVRNEHLELTVRDNGRGFDLEQQHDGWGLDSMRKRAKELGGRLDIQSQPGHGTTVSLTVPLGVLRQDTGHLYKTSN